MVVVRAVERKADIYGSPNLKDWTHLSEFGPAGAVGGVWECPDLFPLAVDGDPANVKWVLVINLNPGSIAGGSGGQYFVGDFDGTTFTSDDPPTYTPPTGTVLQDFEDASFAPWTTTGTAFGDGPAAGQRARAGRRHRVTWATSWPTASTTADGSDASTGLSRRRSSRSTGRLPELPGRRRQPSACARHHARPEPCRRARSSPTSRARRGEPGEDRLDVRTGDFRRIDGPSTPGTIGDQQPVSGYQGEQLVNTFTDHDASTGTITSPAFTITATTSTCWSAAASTRRRRRVTDATAVNLVVDGQVVATATGSDSEHRQLGGWDVVAVPGAGGADRIV